MAVSRAQVSPAPSKLLPHLAFLQSPTIGFVRRHDAEGSDILAQLQQLLAPGQRQLVALHGSGGVGKTTLAVEAVLSLAAAFGHRVVWTGPERRTDFGLGTLLDEVATQLGAPELRQLAPEPKQEAVAALLAAAPALVVLDNFETVGEGKARADAEAEQQRCSAWLRAAPCAVLITSRDNISGARNLRIHALAPAEAREFLERLIWADVQYPDVFTAEVREQISSAAEANPLLMQWIVGQIDDAREPQAVLDELRRGRGSAAERVFDRSFRLAQLGDDGRAVLLALALFVPDAGRDALAEVAGLGDERTRFDEAVTRLARLWLAKPKEGHRRLAVEGLTRQLALARLGQWPDGEAFRRRFVTHLLTYAEAHAKTTPEDFAALECEKDNVLTAMDVAFELQDWQSVMGIARVVAWSTTGLLDLRGYWGSAIERGKQALQAAHNAQSEVSVADFAHNLAIMYQRRGELSEARRLYQQSLEIKERLGDQSGIAITLHQLAMLAQDAGELSEARQLYQQSLEIKERLGNQSGIALALHQLGRLEEDEGQPAEAAQLFRQSRHIFERLGSPKAEIARRSLARVEADE
jgi:tetratricopeptide (TPR) repeat protein